jgi:ferric-dicitrate binding protein FerR (iron transport regulator)
MREIYAGAEDVLCDDSFLSWFFATDQGNVRKWDSWMDASPENRRMVSQAVGLLNSLRIKEKELPPEQISILEDRLLQRIRQLEDRSPGRVISFAEASGNQGGHQASQAGGSRCGYRIGRLAFFWLQVAEA